MKNNESCPVCGLGQVSLQYVTTDVEYGGRAGQVQTALKLCEHCGSEFADAEISRVNKRAMLAFRKTVDGLLSGGEIRALRERFGLNQRQAAMLFGGGPVAFSKYENDDVVQSEAMDKLLRLALGDLAILRRLVEQTGAQSELLALLHDNPSDRTVLADYPPITPSNVVEVDFAQRVWRASPATMVVYQPVETQVDERLWK